MLHGEVWGGVGGGVGWERGRGEEGSVCVRRESMMGGVERAAQKNTGQCVCVRREREMRV